MAEETCDDCGDVHGSEDHTEKLEKTVRKLKWHHRGFAGLFFAAVLVGAYGAYLIHTGLLLMVVGSFLFYFARINLLNLEAGGAQLEQILTSVKEAMKSGDTKSNGHYL